MVKNDKVSKIGGLIPCKTPEPEFSCTSALWEMLDNVYISLNMKNRKILMTASKKIGKKAQKELMSKWGFQPPNGTQILKFSKITYRFFDKIL